MMEVQLQGRLSLYSVTPGRKHMQDSYMCTSWEQAEH